MTVQEGVIRFTLEHSDTPAVTHRELPALRHWHQVLHKHGLISQDSERYGGYAYGNMSVRLKGETFIISGTQTAKLAALENKHYAIVDSCDIPRNHVRSHGPVRPSSECMTHAAIYAAHTRALAIVHIHSPVIWNHWQELELAMTPADVEYGTPAMAKAVEICIGNMAGQDHGSIAMLGHEDGIITFAETVEVASKISLDLLVRAEQFD